MPKGTKVEKAYKGMRKKGYSKGKAARIAQHVTKQSLLTGTKKKKKNNPHPKRGGY